MQKPPPVDVLLKALESFARNVANVLTQPGIDWQRSRGDEDWSLTEVICHLRDVEREVHQPRFKVLIEDDEVFLPGAVADKWVEERNYRAQNGPVALEDFLAAREQTLSLLAGLDAEVWQRQGQHAFFGPTTMHELLYLAVQHDEAHWEQINQLVGAS